MPVYQQNKTSVMEAVGTLRALLYRAGLFFLIFLSIIIIIAGKGENDAVRSVRSQLLDAVVPVVSVLSSPVDAAISFKEYLIQTMNVYEENAILRQENMRLKRIQAIAMQLENENNQLRELLHFVPDPNSSFITARVVGDTSGPYARSALITSGRSQNVSANQVVVNDKGLVGRVIEAGNSSARILLITDLNSKIPIMTGASMERGILAGMNSDFPSIIHLPLDSAVQIGETVVTSGDGEYFPPGIPIGVVHSISDNGVAVKPFVDWGRLGYVSVVNYKVPELKK